MTETIMSRIQGGYAQAVAALRGAARRGAEIVVNAIARAASTEEVEYIARLSLLRADLDLPSAAPASLPLIPVDTSREMYGTASLDHVKARRTTLARDLARLERERCELEAEDDDLALTARVLIRLGQ